MTGGPSRLGSWVRRLLGLPVFLLGAALAGWILYNLLIERRPETRELSPLPAAAVSLGLLFVGYKWLRGQAADRLPWNEF